MRDGRYLIVVSGELGSRYERAFEGMKVVPRTGETEITGPITDQLHLLGLLGRIADLALSILRVTALDNDA